MTLVVRRTGRWHSDPSRIDDDTPEWSAQDFKSAKKLPDMPADFQQAIRRARGLQQSPRKVQTAIRYDANILEAFKADGPGWKTRMNNVLRDSLRSHHRA